MITLPYAKVSKYNANEKKYTDSNIGLEIDQNKKHISFSIFEHRNKHNLSRKELAYSYTVLVDKNKVVLKFLIEEYEKLLKNKYLNNHEYMLLEQLNTAKPFSWTFIHANLWRIVFASKNMDIKFYPTYNIAVIDSKSYNIIEIYIHASNDYKVVFDNNMLTQIFTNENNQWKKIV